MHKTENARTATQANGGDDALIANRATPPIPPTIAVSIAVAIAVKMNAEHP
jgi:hypothetical protein